MSITQSVWFLTLKLPRSTAIHDSDLKKKKFKRALAFCLIFLAFLSWLNSRLRILFGLEWRIQQSSSSSSSSSSCTDSRPGLMVLQLRDYCSFNRGFVASTSRTRLLIDQLSSLKECRDGLAGFGKCSTLLPSPSDVYVISFSIWL